MREMHLMHNRTRLLGFDLLTSRGTLEWFPINRRTRFEGRESRLPPRPSALLHLNDDKPSLVQQPPRVGSLQSQIMPLMAQTRSSRPQPILPISFSVAMSLVIALSYLQVLYGVSYLVRPFWGQDREFPPFKSTIVRWERVAVELILCILPLPSCGSHSLTPTSTLYEDLPAHRITSIHTSRVSFNELRSGPSGMSEPHSMPQCYPETSAERLAESQTFGLGSPRRMPADHCSKSESSIEDTMRDVMMEDQPKVSAVEVIQQVPPAYTRPSPSVQLPEEHSNSRVMHEHDLYDTDTVEETHSRSQLAPISAVDGPSDTAPRAQLSGEVSDEDGLKLSKRVIKCHSTETYPGSFPVSESTELSSLATAEYAFRERGTTSVRPFSDY